MFVVGCEYHPSFQQIAFVDTENGELKEQRLVHREHRQDAQHILGLLLKDDFPSIWVPSWENRDLRQLLWHRHRGASANSHHEPTAGSGAERRTPLPEEVVAGSPTRAEGGKW